MSQLRKLRGKLKQRQRAARQIPLLQRHHWYQVTEEVRVAMWYLRQHLVQTVNSPFAHTYAHTYHMLPENAPWCSRRVHAGLALLYDACDLFVARQHAARPVESTENAEDMEAASTMLATLLSEEDTFFSAWCGVSIQDASIGKQWMSRYLENAVRPDFVRSSFVQILAILDAPCPIAALEEPPTP